MKNSKSLPVIKPTIVKKQESIAEYIDPSELLPMNRKAERIATRVIRNLSKE
jgi:hypothetical protein